MNRYYLELIELYNRLNESAKSHMDYRGTLRSTKEMILKEYKNNIK